MSRTTRIAEINQVLAAALLAVVAVLIKLIPGGFTGPFLSMARFAIGIGLGLLYLQFTGTPLRVEHKLTWVLRGFFGSVAMALNFTAVQMTGTGRATLLLNTFPIFVAIFGFLIFREALTRRQLVSIALCVIGVIFVFYDGSSYSLWGNLIGLASGVIRGLATHFIKRSATRNDPVVVYLSACFWGMALLPMTASEIAHLSWDSGFVLLLIGGLSFLAQALMTHGMRAIDPIKASLLTYTTIPLTLGLGVLIGEELRGKFFVGMAFIAVGLIVNIAHGFKNNYTPRV